MQLHAVDHSLVGAQLKFVISPAAYIVLVLCLLLALTIFPSHTLTIFPYDVGCRALITAPTRRLFKKMIKFGFIADVVVVIVVMLRQRSISRRILCRFLKLPIIRQHIERDN